MKTSVLIVWMVIASLTGYAQNGVRGELQSGNSDPASRKKWSKVIVKFNPSIITRLSIHAFSKDSVMVYTTFVNRSQEVFYLYKPLLPSNTLMQNSVLDFIIENGQAPESIPFADTSAGKYYEGSRAIVPVVIPELKSGNFLILQPRDSLVFTINAARYYIFRPNTNGENGHYSASYSALMPYIHGQWQQIFEVEKGKGKAAKPVFYSIGMPKAGPDDRYLYQRVDFSIENE